MSPAKDRRDGKDRRAVMKGQGTVRAWLAVLGTLVGTGGGIQLGRQHEQSNMTQETAKMLIHPRDREIDGLRDDIKGMRAEFIHRFERLEDRMPNDPVHGKAARRPQLAAG